ncbi:hypothetical protein G7074_01960 [Pedobacter sp. HDW13]|uniref:hypothetical protein n=1 Tax=unclassified Pedobacter TaxID=2628915 RepID=UPI000F59B7B8|nr:MULTISPECIES: hypothetical protein [unclassified Pedobacter]QIL38148.1 hypothetical protein G7074_01960 [Pedobacter sp. HDW13]RQO69113.1 hypothetical protein DBR40_19260 [Pedobacter sp. KBW01]
METNKEKGKVVENDLLDKKAEAMRDDSLDENKSSKITTNLFSKNDKRKNNPLGPGHEPGPTPGSGI